MSASNDIPHTTTSSEKPEGIRKKRRTLKDAESDLVQSRMLLSEAKKKLIQTARENAKMKVLLMKYIDKDDTLISHSQLSSTDTESQKLSQNSTGILCLSQEMGYPSKTGTGTSNTENIGWMGTDIHTDENGDESQAMVNLSQMSQFSQFSQASHWSELSSTSNLEDILNFLDKQEMSTDSTLSETMTSVDSCSTPIQTSVHVRVGVGVILTSTKHPNCVLVGKRKGSHGAGKLALPGGHLEMLESWEECGVREVKEETDLDLAKDNLSYVYLTNDPMKAEGKHYITIFLHANIDGKMQPKNMEPHKCEGWSWMKWEELQKADNLFIPLHHITRSGFKLPSFKNDKI